MVGECNIRWRRYPWGMWRHCKKCKLKVLLRVWLMWSRYWLPRQFLKRIPRWPFRVWWIQNRWGVWYIGGRGKYGGQGASGDHFIWWWSWHWMRQWMLYYPVIKGMAAQLLRSCWQTCWARVRHWAASGGSWGCGGLGTIGGFGAFGVCGRCGGAVTTGGWCGCDDFVVCGGCDVCDVSGSFGASGVRVLFDSGVTGVQIPNLHTCMTKHQASGGSMCRVSTQRCSRTSPPSLLNVWFR